MRPYVYDNAPDGGNGNPSTGTAPNVPPGAQIPPGTAQPATPGVYPVGSTPKNATIFPGFIGSKIGLFISPSSLSTNNQLNSNLVVSLK